MNSNLQLHPSLEVIRSRLFGEADVVDLPAEANTDLNGPDGESAMPAWMRDMVTRAALQKAATVPAGPAAGQIWSVAYEGQIAGKAVSGRIPMLLDQQQENGIWSGWLVTADTDYATRADVILDTRENGINPIACMVQTWNRVGAFWQANAPYLGQLDAPALNVVRAVAVEPQSSHPPKGLPGHLQQRQVSDGLFALSGDHLGDAQDPRWTYRRLYLELAELLPAISLDNEHDL